MASRGSEDTQFIYPDGPTYRPPVALLGGILWSLAIASFGVLWAVVDFQRLVTPLAGSVVMLRQVVVVLAVFAMTAPAIFSLRRHARAG